MNLADRIAKHAAIWAAYAVCMLCVVMFGVPLGYAAAADRQLTGPVQAIVERVIDGDTLAVRARIWLGQELRVNVRIARIDTPELSSRCVRERQLAVRAREFMRNILFTEGQIEPTIWLSDIDQDKYGGRVLARVTAPSGDDVAKALVQAGLARAYDGKKRINWCSDI
jgi:endonuclease YncB( thermonuclease family)